MSGLASPSPAWEASYQMVNGRRESTDSIIERRMPRGAKNQMVAALVEGFDGMDPQTRNYLIERHCIKRGAEGELVFTARGRRIARWLDKKGRV